MHTASRRRGQLTPLALLLIAGCGADPTTDDVVEADAAPGPTSWFRVDGVDYPLPWQEAYLQAGTPDVLIVRGSGDPDGRCNPAETIACYELVATLPVDATGVVACGGPTKLTLLIDGGTSATFVAGVPFGGSCSISVDRVDPVGGSVMLSGLAGVLTKVGDVEQNTPITAGSLAAARGDDR